MQQAYNEEHGITPVVAAACSRLVTIPGGGKIESLNVSVAGAVLMFLFIATTSAIALRFLRRREMEL